MIKVIVGAQWGDEGKGKMVDYFAAEADLVVRFQGGDNAGHTVANQYGVFKLHLIPCGIFYDGVYNLVGTGTVVNPDELLTELEQLKAAGLNTGRVKISDKAHIVMPYHVTLDGANEKGSGAIGTTKRGIGPAYSGKALRTNLRIEDLYDLEYCRARIEKSLPLLNAELAFYGADPINAGFLMEKCAEWARRLGGHFVNPVSFVHSYIDAGKNILFEGQLGVMKDIDLGIYPYVTSSHPVAAYAAVSTGFPARKIDEVVGVMKAFSSAVGAGPFPTEMNSDDARALRGSGEQIDDEFGARTGRARRIGWPDLAVARYAHLVNGFTGLAVSKIDKLDTLKAFKVCTAYELDGEKLDYMPSSKDLYRVKPVYTTVKGWLSDTRGCSSIAALPAAARDYIALIERVVGCPVKYVGVGPDRKDILL
ncbi:MAG: adenylosuccinate synthase [Firmicutes bacterium]|nr:adenylosuccinate synthase [Bacillota bacterium]